MGGSWVRSRQYWGAISVVLQAARDRVGVDRARWVWVCQNGDWVMFHWVAWMWIEAHGGVRSRRCWDAASQCWCMISPVLRCNELVLVCDLRGASGGASSSVLVCDLSSLLFLSLFCFPVAELI